jgi:G3E family GTPase
VLHTLMLHPYLAMRYRLDGIITLVDAVNGAATLDAHAEAVKQVAVADRLVLTKTDLIRPPADLAADLVAGNVPHDVAHDVGHVVVHLATTGPAPQTEEFKGRLRALNPAAPMLDAAAGEAVAARLLDCGLYDPACKIPDVRRWLAAEAYAEPHDHHAALHAGRDPNRHDAHIRAFSLTTAQAIPASALEMFLDLVRAMHGPHLLRLKGIVKLAEEENAPVVVHAVQHIMHPVVRLARWPDADRSTRLVFILHDIEPSVIRQLFNAFLGAAAPDRPDRAAIVDNPLVPFGGIDR